MKSQLRNLVLTSLAVLFAVCNAGANADTLGSSGACPCFSEPVQQKLKCYSHSKIDAENFWSVEFEDGFFKVNIGTFSKEVTFCAPTPAAPFCGAIQVSTPVSCMNIAPLTSDQLGACNAVIEQLAEQQKLPVC